MGTSVSTVCSFTSVTFTCKWTTSDCFLINKQIIVKLPFAGWTIGKRINIFWKFFITDRDCSLTIVFRTSLSSPFRLPVCLSISLSAYLSVCLFVCMPICHAYLSGMPACRNCLPCLPVCFSVCFSNCFSVFFAEVAEVTEVMGQTVISKLPLVHHNG